MAPIQEPRPAYPHETETLRSGSAPVPERLVAAGHLLRRRGSTSGEDALVDSALQAIAAGEMAQSLGAVRVAEVKQRLRRGADEAFEVAFADTKDEKELWSSAAFEALRDRDRLASLSTAAARWTVLHEGAAAEVASAALDLSARITELDRDLRATARYFTAVNPLRRRALDELLPEFRREAWWYADRVEDDELLRVLADQGDRDPPTERLSPAIASDLAASRLPLRAGLAEASRIGAEVDALIEEL